MDTILEVIAFVKKEFPEALIKINEEHKYADVFIDCLNDKTYQVTLDIRPFGTQIGKLDTTGDFNPFDLNFSDVKDVKSFLLKCKATGRFEI